MSHPMNLLLTLRIWVLIILLHLSCSFYGRAKATSFFPVKKDQPSAFSLFLNKDTKAAAVEYRKPKYYPEEDELEIMDKAFIRQGDNPYVLVLRPNANQSANSPTYKWTFAAADDCMPQMTCTIFNLAPPNYEGKCMSQYIEITDGIVGGQRFCGKSGPIGIVATATRQVRDIYVSYKNTIKGYSAEFECYVSCGERDKSKLMTAAVQPRVNQKCMCGKKPNKNRIIGGSETYVGEFPWMAAMVVAQTRQPYCIGSVINDRMILTAGHCFKGKFRKVWNSQVILNGYMMDPMPNINVVKGPVVYKTYDNQTLEKLDAGNNTFRFDVDRIWIHPLYNSENSDFDTALMILSKPIDSTVFKTYSPICLPELSYDVESYAGYTGVMSGWGLPSVEALGTITEMQQITVKIFKPDDCKHYFGERFVSARRMMCAAYPDASQDSCAGDSGGPLIVQYRPHVWYQVGIISWGDSCAVLDNPGVYYRTTSTNQWIRHISNSKEAVWCDTP